MPKLMTLRKLNELGVDRFFDFCIRKKEDQSLKTPLNLIEESETSEDSGLNIEIDTEKIFSNRLELGKYLWEKFKSVWDESLRQDSGLWSGLALIYFDQFCPSNRTNDPEHYILTAGKWRGSGFDYHYRHCVLMPLRIVKDYPEYEDFFLCGTENSPYKDMTNMGEGIEQVASKQKVMRNKNILKSVMELYRDPKTGRVKTASMSAPIRKKNEKTGKWRDQGKGGARRYTKLELNRLDLVYSTASIEYEKIIELAGEEFSNSQFCKPSKP